MTIDEARAIAQVRSDGQLAKFFIVSRAAVSQWRKNGQIPKYRVLQLKDAVPKPKPLDQVRA